MNTKLAITAMVILSLAAAPLSGGVTAQTPAQPSYYIGDATVDGDPAPEGTTIIMAVDGQQVDDSDVGDDGVWGSELEDGAIGEDTNQGDLSTDPNAGDVVTFHIDSVDNDPADIEVISSDANDPVINSTALALEEAGKAEVSLSFESIPEDQEENNNDPPENTGNGNGGGAAPGPGAGDGQEDADDDAPPTVTEVRNTLDLVDPSTTTQTEITDADPDTSGTQVTPEGTESVQSISFNEEGLSGNVDINEFNDPPQQIRDDVASSVTAAGAAADGSSINTISVADITPDNDAAADSAATVTFSVPASEVDTPEQLTVFKETYSQEQQADTWSELPTTVDEVGDEEITVSAEAESFSLFAVAEVEQTDGDGTADDGAEDDDGAADDGATDDGLPGFGAVAALLALVGTMLYARRHA